MALSDIVDTTVVVVRPLNCVIVASAAHGRAVAVSGKGRQLGDR